MYLGQKLNPKNSKKRILKDRNTLEEPKKKPEI